MPESRVARLAMELGRPVRDLMQGLTDLGTPAKTPSSIIDGNTVERLRQLLTPTSTVDDWTAPPETAADDESDSQNLMQWLEEGRATDDVLDDAAQILQVPLNELPRRDRYRDNGSRSTGRQRRPGVRSYEYWKAVEELGGAQTVSTYAPPVDTRPPASFLTASGGDPDPVRQRRSRPGEFKMPPPTGGIPGMPRPAGRVPGAPRPPASSTARPLVDRSAQREARLEQERREQVRLAAERDARIAAAWAHALTDQTQRRDWHSAGIRDTEAQLVMTCEQAGITAAMLSRKLAGRTVLNRLRGGEAVSQIVARLRELDENWSSRSSRSA